jgi:two-component system phosphate regulon sensor histidine kinase PhoR
VRLRVFLALLGLAGATLALFAALATANVPGPGALALLAAAALALAFSRLLPRPVLRAARFAEKLARGQAPSRLPETEPGVLGDLYRALNRLAEAQRLGQEERGAASSETELLLQEMGEGVLALDGAGRVVRANAELRAVIGSSDRVEGRALATIFRNPELVAFLAPERVPEEGGQAEFEVFGRTMLVTARRRPAGGVVAVFSDLSELRRLDAVRTEFVANASHELKTPLTAIRGYAETLLDPNLPAPERASFAKRMVEHAGRMAALVDDLLTLARLEDPQREIRSERVALRRLAEQILDAFAARLSTSKIEASVELDPPDLAVNADPEGLRQILENLVDNAIRHSSGRRLALRGERLSAGVVQICVADDGRGVPSDHLDRIFERFYRADPSRSRATGGTGLGLSIVKHWAEAMGGAVRAESEVGRGTRVYLTLPAGSPASE